MVGELHSLTDWHVSEASDDAELDDFWRGGNRQKDNTLVTDSTKKKSKQVQNKLMFMLFLKLSSEIFQVYFQIGEADNLILTQKFTGNLTHSGIFQPKLYFPKL